MPAKRDANAVPAAKPEPDIKEKRAIAEVIERAKVRIPPASVKVEGGAGTADQPLGMGSPHADAAGWGHRLAATFGTLSEASLQMRLGEISRLAARAGAPPGETEINAALAFVSAVAPEDEMEAALAVQMFGAHTLATELLMRAKHSNRMDQLTEYTNLATKLQRTFTGQIEALAKLRRGGEQIVRHIHVDNRGGQAIIAETVNTGGVNGGSGGQPHGPDTASAISPSLLGFDPAGNGVPMPSTAREAPVPIARRQKPRRPDRKPACA